MAFTLILILLQGLCTVRQHLQLLLHPSHGQAWQTLCIKGSKTLNFDLTTRARNQKDVTSLPVLQSRYSSTSTKYLEVLKESKDFPHENSNGLWLSHSIWNIQWGEGWPTVRALGVAKRGLSRSSVGRSCQSTSRPSLKHPWTNTVSRDGQHHALFGCRK